MADVESKRIGARVKAAARAAASAGRRYGGRHVPFGYDRAAPGALIANPVDARAVRVIVSELLAGRSYATVCRSLNDAGIARREGGRWNTSALQSLIRHNLATWAGLATYKGEVVAKGTWEPIITRDDYEKAHTLLLDRATGERRGRKSRHLLNRGLLRCGVCGSTMRCESSRTSERLRRGYYVCARNVHEKGTCAMPNVRHEIVDDAILSYFEGAVLDREGTIREMSIARERELTDVRARREEAEREVMRLDEAMARLDRFLRDGRLTPEEWRDQREMTSAERAAARGQAERLVAHERGYVTAVAEVELAAEMEQRLHDLRTTIIESIREAADRDLDAVRAALRVAFECFHIEYFFPNGRHGFDQIGDALAHARWPPRYSEALEATRADGTGYCVIPTPRPAEVDYENDLMGVSGMKRRTLPLTADAPSHHLSSRESRRSASSRPFVWHRGQ